MKKATIWKSPWKRSRNEGEKQIALLHQEHRTRPLDLASDLAMKVGWHSGDPTWEDLAAFGYKFLQEIGIFVIECLCCDINPATRHDSIRTAKIGPAFGVFRFHLALLNLPVQGMTTQEWIVLFLFQAARRIGAFFIARADVSRGWFACGLCLSALENDNFPWHKRLIL
jgi:hypothetical protein